MSEIKITYNDLNRDQVRKAIDYLRDCELGSDGTFIMSNESLELKEINSEPISREDSVVFHGVNKNLIKYQELANMFFPGTYKDHIFSNANSWLHFTLDGKELYVAKLPILNYITINELQSRGLVCGINNEKVINMEKIPRQTNIVMLKGKKYVVRLLKGMDSNPPMISYDSYLQGTHKSEWSRLFYPIISDDPFLNAIYKGIKNPIYTNSDLGFHDGPGSLSWCQESQLDKHICRGYRTVTHVQVANRKNNSTLYSWRPVLELIT